MTERATRWWPFAVALAITAGLMCCAAGGIDVSDLLCLLPALVLGGVLLARRYPGERLLLRIARNRRPQSGRAQAFRSASTHRLTHMPRGGLLMAFALAVRPPPGSPAAS
ncbi:MAG TPA: hypothetical protein VLJ42_07135 [Solirubrobacteraceae bacterium]|nr:hypothetical protein [Solirubrobacteraceae bacterium]